MHRKANDNHGASWLDGVSQFQTTEWTQVQKSGLNQAVMGELYLKYRKPVYLYLRGRGFKDDQARELIQDFFTEKVLGQQLFHKADRSKGKFRTFLLTAIRNYAIDRHRTAKPMQQLDDNLGHPSHKDEPSKAFNRAWATQVLEQTLKELELESQMHGKQQHWNIFRVWLVEPDLSPDKPDMASLCRQLGIKDASTAYNMISNMKGRFKVILRRCLHRYVSSESQIDEEIQSLLGVFCN
jgi:DNA-directed RNA polymerase specialized sigma24 family protein